MYSEQIQVLIKVLPGNDDLPLPKYQTDLAVALDLHAAILEPLSLFPHQIVLVPCGFALAVPTGYEAQIRPRSGLVASDAITVANSPGTVDPDYRGELRVALLNQGNEVFVVERGMRIAQLVFAPVVHVQWIKSDHLPPTQRGPGGFGHTGR